MNQKSFHKNFCKVLALSRNLLSTICLCPCSLTAQQQQLAFLERGNSTQNKNYITHVICSHGIIEYHGLGGILKPTQPQPTAMVRAASHQLNLPRAPSNCLEHLQRWGTYRLCGQSSSGTEPFPFLCHKRVQDRCG